MQNNYIMEIPHYSEMETFVSTSVPPENAIPFLFPLLPKNLCFCFHSADFHFRFHIFILFLFFHGKVGKFQLHYHPYAHGHGHGYGHGLPLHSTTARQNVKT
jgi:hypothetical protein